MKLSYNIPKVPWIFFFLEWIGFGMNLDFIWNECLISLHHSILSASQSMLKFLFPGIIRLTPQVLFSVWSPGSLPLSSPQGHTLPYSLHGQASGCQEDWPVPSTSLPVPPGVCFPFLPHHFFKNSLCSHNSQWIMFSQLAWSCTTMPSDDKFHRPNGSPWKWKLYLSEQSSAKKHGQLWKISTF